MKRIVLSMFIACGVALSGPAFASDAGVSAPAGEGPAAAPSAPAVDGPVPDVVKEMEGGAVAAPAAAPSLADRFEALKAEYDAYKAAKAGDATASERRIALWGLLGALTMLLLAGLKYLDSKYSEHPKLKRFLPWVALALAFAAGLFDALVVGGGPLQAMYTATGPILAVLMHELKEGWTGARARTYAGEVAAKPVKR